MDGFSWNRERPGDEIHWLKCTRDKQNLAWRNSWRFATPPLVFPRSDVWGTSAEIPYSHPHSTLTKFSHHIWVVLLIGLACEQALRGALAARRPGELARRLDWSCREGNLLQPLKSTTQIWVITHHQYGNFCAPSLLTRHLEKPVVATQNVGCLSVLLTEPGRSGRSI